MGPNVSGGRDRVAQALPGYEVGAELGRGSFGVVWAGEHRRVGRRVAIKELTAADMATRERFVAEARVLALLEHPHVVPLYDYVEDDDRCLLVMERLNGGTLVERFFAPRAIDIASACAVAMVTCAGLHHAHVRGVLHRDVKPENLLFSADGVLKVTDFGVAKVLAAGAGSHRTTSGELKGTPAYMAPEQLTGRDIGPGVDIYATALLLYELLTGQLPFSDEGEPIAVALRRLTDDPTPLAEVAPDLRGPLADAVMQALNLAPADRFATAEDFGVAISRAATTTLGAGWLAGSEVRLIAAGPILDSAHEPGPSTGPTVARARRVSVPPRSPGPPQPNPVASSANSTVVDELPWASAPPTSSMGATVSGRIACLSCGEMNPAGGKFCATCGAAMAANCPACGSAVEPGAHFCGQCGRPVGAATGWAATPLPTLSAPAPPVLPSEGERKQLTVLFADVEGAFDLQESLEPEDWAAIVGRFAAIVTESVERFEGSVDRSTGEGVKAIFGVPLALEDHGQRACLAAFEIIRAVGNYTDELRRAKGLDFQVCIGLNSGEAVVERVGDDFRLDPTALSRTVGLAQRMEALAGPGQAYLTEQTERLVRDGFHLRELGPMTVKGAHHPMRVFALGAPVEAGDSRRRPQSPMVGREAEMAMLEGALAQATAGRAQVVGVVAEAGAGKSRLCDEFAAVASRRGVLVRRAAGVSHARGVPLLPVLALLRNYFGIGEAESRSDIWEKVANYVLALDPAFEEDLPLLYDFLGEPDPERPSPTLAPDVRMRRIFDLLRRLTARRSEHGVLILLLEDLHWFDPQSEAFVERLVEWVHGSRTLVLTNFRPEFSASWMRHSYYRQLSLSQLADEAVATLLEDLLGGHPSLAPLAGFVNERTSGNPFFVEEVVRDLVEDGTLVGRPGGYHLARPMDDIRVPASVHAVLAARIDRLPPAHKSLLQTAAVIGRTFPEPVLAAVMGRPASDLDDALRALCAAELLQESGYGRVAQYRFWHPLTQEVAYSSLLARRRKKLHAAVAEQLAQFEPDRLDEVAAVLAWHWERAGRKLEAARWNVRAAGFALRSDLTDALSRWQQAVDLLEGEDSAEGLELGVRARIFLLLFRARVGIDRAGAERLYADAIALAARLGDLGLQGLVDLVAGSVSTYAGDVVGGLAHYLDAARRADATEDPDFAAALVSGVPFALSYLGPLADALAASDRLQAACAGDAERGAAVLGYSVLARSLRVRAMILTRAGRLDEAAAALDEAITLARARGDSDTLCWSLPIRSHLAWLTGENAETTAPAAETVQLAEDTGNVLGLVFGLEGLALALLTAGQPAEAVAACERALAEAQARSGLNEEAGVLAALALARLAGGDGPGARAAADEAVAVARRQGLRVVECQAVLAQAQVRRATGDPGDSVAASLAAGLDLVRATGALTFEPFLREELGRIGMAVGVAAAGTNAGAAQQLHEALRLYREIGATGHARRLQAELATWPPRAESVLR